MKPCFDIEEAGRRTRLVDQFGREIAIGDRIAFPPNIAQGVITGIVVGEGPVLDAPKGLPPMRYFKWVVEYIYSAPEAMIQVPVIVVDKAQPKPELVKPN